MKIEVTQENLNNALVTVGRVAGVRTTLPILANILISTDGKQLRLAATNLEIGMVHRISGKISEEGSLTVPARLMQDFIASLPPSNVLLETEGQKLHITAGKYKSTINGLAADEFPSIPEISGSNTINLPAADLKSALSQTVFAASSDETRPVLTAVYMHSAGSEICMAATDSYRLAERKIKPGDNFPEDLSLLVPARSLSEAQRVLDGSEDSVEFSWDDAQAQFRHGKTTIVTRLVDGNYPAYKELLPKKSEVNVTIDRNELLNITKVASLFAKESAGGVKVSINEEEQSISIHSVASQVGENTSSANAKVKGSGEVTLNSRYLIDALNAINTQAVSFSISGKLNPCLLTSKDDPGYLHVIMPLRS